MERAGGRYWPDIAVRGGCAQICSEHIGGRSQTIPVISVLTRIILTSSLAFHALGLAGVSGSKFFDVNPHMSRKLMQSACGLAFGMACCGHKSPLKKWIVEASLQISNENAAAQSPQVPSGPNWLWVLAIVSLLSAVIVSARWYANLLLRRIEREKKELEVAVRERSQELDEKQTEIDKAQRAIDSQQNELLYQRMQLDGALLELEETRDRYVERARKAGMAEMATGVIHNVGNILNSVHTDLALSKEKLKDSSLAKLANANKVLLENMVNISEFLTRDPRGKKLLTYYLAIEELWIEENAALLEHTQRLKEKVDVITEVIQDQQQIAKGHNISEEISLSAMVERSLELSSDLITRNEVSVDKVFENVGELPLHKVKLHQILMNLFKNAVESMQRQTPEDRVLTIKIYGDSIYVYLTVTDTGQGIDPANLKKIFTHGFTTKDDGHGFGLHSARSYMSEMNGKIWAESEGLGKGACFVLSFEIPHTQEGTSADDQDPLEVTEVVEEPDASPAQTGR